MERWHTDGLTIRDENGLRVADAAVAEDAALIAAAPALFAALLDLRSAVGRTGWQNAAPLISERASRAALLNRVNLLLAEVKR